MPLTITDEQLQYLQMNERDARIEIACRMFDAGKLSLPMASKFAGLSRVQFEDELHRRGIAAYRPTIEDLREELEELKRQGI